ncbi:sulfurtransferase TusA family protein [Falsiroseomonas ponticola]|uniref:sulfurtransferase TusA family protein n=1 Tax=Falsiroseomonas ponticola TaxID=2786951 RepID=UPI0019343FDA|nr:sulfurtransferase TusA family protein [Roseomonas ponticola]
MTFGDEKGRSVVNHPGLQEQSHDVALDITTETCPMTFVRTRLALDRMSSGQVLLVRMKGEEPRRNVPRTAAEQGHGVLGVREGEGGVTEVWLRRK